MNEFIQTTDVNDLCEGNLLRISFGDNSMVFRIVAIHVGEKERVFHLCGGPALTLISSSSDLKARFWVHVPAPEDKLRSFWKRIFG